MEIILAFLSAFLVTYITIPAIIRVANEKHLFDFPDNIRKTHVYKIPTLGGVAIFAGAVISSTFFIDFHEVSYLSYMFSAIIILFFIGIKDDIIPLTPAKKFAAQLISALIIVFKCDIRLTSLYGLWGFNTLYYEWSVILTVFTILVVINSFNLLDGINGLAGGIGVIVCFTFAYFLYMLGKPQLVIFGMAMVGALLGFLRYNFIKDAKIIMGDTGSLTLGLFVAILCIEFIEINAKSFNPILKPSFVPVFSFTILIIPLFDTLRVFIVRIWNKKSPFQGDRNHIHHFLVDSGMSHLKAAGLLFTVNITLIITAYSLQFLPSSILLVLMLVMAFILSLLAYWNKEKKNLSFYLNRIFLIKRS